MAHLFSSTTGDTKYNLFFGPREMHQFNNWGTELFELVTQQKLNYWPIEMRQSSVHKLYGESIKKVSRNPILFYASIRLMEPEIITGSTTDRKTKIEVHAHRDRLTEIGLFPRIGDYLEWDNKFFEIYYADVPKFTQGQPSTKIDVKIEAIHVSESVFNPRIEAVYDDTIDHDSQNPYN